MRVIGVQSDGATAAYDSWTSGFMQSRPATTRVSGLATAHGFETPQSIMRGDAGGAGSLGLQGFDLVTDDEIDAAATLLARHARVLAEGAGAAALAGLVARQGTQHGTTGLNARSSGTAAVVVTGGNVSADEWAHLAAAMS